MVYVAELTALGAKPPAVAMARSVAVLATGIAAEYVVEDAVGVEPSVV